MKLIYFCAYSEIVMMVLFSLLFLYPIYKIYKLIQKWLKK